MGDEDLRQIIEDNFRLLALSMREVGSRTGKMETELGELKVDLTERLNSVQSLAAQNQTSFEEMAQRLESVVEAVKTLRSEMPSTGGSSAP